MGRVTMVPEIVVDNFVNSMICSIYIFFVFGSLSFYSFKVTDSLVEKFGSGATAFAIVRAPLGWVGIGLSIFSMGTYLIFNCLRQRNVKHTMDKFNVEEAKQIFKKLYKDTASAEYKKYEKTPEVTIDKTMRSSIIDLFFKIMNEVLTKNLEDTASELPIRKEYLNKIYEQNKKKNYMSKESPPWMSKEKLQEQIKGSSAVEFMVKSILRDGAEKVIEGLQSKKEWIKEDELLSEKMEDDFAGVMAAEFTVIIHILKRKIVKEAKSSERLLRNEPKSFVMHHHRYPLAKHQQKYYENDKNYEKSLNVYRRRAEVL